MKLTDKIHLLKLAFHIQLPAGKTVERYVNCVVVFGKKITLIDTGTKGCETIISTYIKANGRDISDLDTIILSHAHPDHIGSAAILKKQAGCRVLAHAIETEWIENIELQNRQRPVPGFFSLVDQPVAVDAPLEHGQVLQADDDIHLEIIHNPGHSKGSVNILFKEDKILFTADSVPVVNDIPSYDSFTDLVSGLESIRNNPGYDTLLTSWSNALWGRDKIAAFLDEGAQYLETLDKTVKRWYAGKEPEPLSFCRKVIHTLNLPPFYVNPIVDQAFKGHQP